MGVSIYYTVTRDKELSIDECNQINNIIEKYNNTVDYEECEKMGYYNCKYNIEKNEIFSGSVKLPADYEDEGEFFDKQMDVGFHWMDCLTEIRRKVLKDGNWSVDIDGKEWLWDNVHGYSL